MTNKYHERFLYGTIVTTGLVTYLWHIHASALTALYTIVSTIALIAVAEAYVEIVAFKIANKRAIDRQEFNYILGIEFDIMRSLTWVVPIFALAYFHVIPLTFAYIGAIGVSIIVLFGFGYHFGVITGKRFHYRVLLGLGNMAIGFAIIGVKYLVK